MLPPVVRLTPPRASGVQLLSSEVRAWNMEEVPLAQASEVERFVTQKRRDEHLTGRWLLGQGLRAWGVDDLTVVEVVRNERRAPSLAYIQGVWKRTPLPNISIAHTATGWRSLPWWNRTGPWALTPNRSVDNWRRTPTT